MPSPRRRRLKKALRLAAFRAREEAKTVVDKVEPNKEESVVEEKVPLVVEEPVIKKEKPKVEPKKTPLKKQKAPVKNKKYVKKDK